MNPCLVTDCRVESTLRSVEWTICRMGSTAHSTMGQLYMGPISGPRSSDSNLHWEYNLFRTPSTTRVPYVPSLPASERVSESPHDRDKGPSRGRCCG